VAIDNLESTDIHVSESKYRSIAVYVLLEVRGRNADSVPKGNFGMDSTVPQSARLHSLDRLPGLSLIAFSPRAILQ